jgi:hypothetical protein
MPCPGPTTSRGRSAPVIDIFKAEKDDFFTTGQVASHIAHPLRMIIYMGMRRDLDELA